MGKGKRNRLKTNECTIPVRTKSPKWFFVIIGLAILGWISYAYLTAPKYAHLSSTVSQYYSLHQAVREKWWLPTITSDQRLDNSQLQEAVNRTNKDIDELVRLGKKIPELGKIVKSFSEFQFLSAIYINGKPYELIGGSRYNDAAKSTIVKIAYLPKTLWKPIGYYPQNKSIELPGIEMSLKLKRTILAHELYHAANPKGDRRVVSDPIHERGAYRIGWRVLNLETNGKFDQIITSIVKRNSSLIGALNSIEVADLEKTANLLDSKMGPLTCGLLSSQVVMAVIDKFVKSDAEWEKAYNDTEFLFTKKEKTN